MQWPYQIKNMHEKFGVHEWVKNKLHEKDNESLHKFLKFRMAFLKEEFEETQEAFENHDPEELIDGLIDLCVIAIGTLDAFGVDADEAWREVYEANMNKMPGIKPERPNPLGLPDLIKDENWKGPDHRGNHGILPDCI